ncbi:MAG: hypothetical protein HY703_06925 [Gemmatimonadetes bacterium]|nr:hypothetical protein [Gemmatimonadota bacterium]
MSEPGRPARGIVVAHGSLAQGLVDAAQRITGAGPEVLGAVSNQGLSPELLAAQIRELIGPEPTILFTDLQSGSCGFAARRLGLEHPGVVVISGVNLPVLLEFVTHRELPLTELVPRLLSRGRNTICCAPAELERDAHRAISSG